MRVFILGSMLLTCLIPFSIRANVLEAGDMQISQLTSVCLEFTATGNRKKVEKRICTEPGQESDWLWIGDDTGYRNQNLRVTAYGRGEVCLRFTAVNGRGKLLDRGWVCSSNGAPSNQLWIGDDTGYRKQNLRIRTNSGASVCLDSIRRGRRGEQRTGWVCSASNNPSEDNYLGDDSGYKNQRLKIRLSSN